jgi:hypothetical protein
MITRDFVNKLIEKTGAGISVLLVTCTPGSSACYLNGKDFYLRTIPATNKLEGPDLVDYCKQRFN